MSREYCQYCHRPQSACICHLVCEVDNDIHVVVLQHPSEVKQSKGSVTLLAHSLSNCQVIVGEQFDGHAEISALLSQYQNNIALLYPSENALVLSDESENVTAPKCLIILDATWKKSYKMFMSNLWLQELPHICLANGIIGQYQIRKTKKKNALSSLEACCYALTALEKSSHLQKSAQLDNKYQRLLDSFVQFNQFHLALNPNL